MEPKCFTVTQTETFKGYKSQRTYKTTEVLLGQRSRSFGNHEECLKIRLVKFLSCTFEFSSRTKV